MKLKQHYKKVGISQGLSGYKLNLTTKANSNILLLLATIMSNDSSQFSLALGAPIEPVHNLILIEINFLQTTIVCSAIKSSSLASMGARTKVFCA